MDTLSPDQHRIMNASPSTRRVMRLGGLWMLLCLVLSMVAAGLTAYAPLGIVTHPPAAYSLMAFLLAAVSFLFGMFFTAYLSRTKTRVGHWAFTAFGGALFFGVTLSALGWAIPAMSTVYAPHQSTRVMTVTGTSDLAISRLGCRHRAYFGSVLRPRGHVCVDTINTSGRSGWRLSLRGDGNHWATWITKASVVL